MKARFIGGSLDGTTREREVWGREFINPVRYGNPAGSVDDMKWVNLDTLCDPKPAKLQTETYVRVPSMEHDRDPAPPDTYCNGLPVTVGPVRCLVFKLEASE